MQSSMDKYVVKAHYVPIEDSVRRSQHIDCCHLIFGALKAVMST